MTRLSSGLALLILVLIVDPIWATSLMEPETSILPSPKKAASLILPDSEKVRDFDVSPLGPEAVILLAPSDGQQKVKFWDLQKNNTPFWILPKDFSAQSVVWHPKERRLFFAGKSEKGSAIYRAEVKNGEWKAAAIFSTSKVIRRLVVGPRPFETGQGAKGIEYRLFFGQLDSLGSYSIQSITESGNIPYQVIGKQSGQTPSEERYEEPSDLISASALPLGFHPAGHLMLWQNKSGCFEIAEYTGKNWGESKPALTEKICDGTLTIPPNGLGFFHWQKEKPGVEWLHQQGKQRQTMAQNHLFEFTPSSVVDGKGMVGLEKKSGKDVLAYVPLSLPLADVMNAWMFVESEAEMQRFSSVGGLMRPTQFEQMYQLYDTELYSCGDYSSITPTRPYLITTDAFWEVFAAAFDALFVVTEKQIAIPAFWDMIAEGQRFFADKPMDSHWKKVFSVLENLRRGALDPDGEVQRIQAAQENLFSPLFQRKVNYGELKPRGNYASNAEFSLYFKAFTYLTKSTLPENSSPDKNPLQELESTSKALKEKALAWITPYRIFIAEARTPLAWESAAYRKPRYLKFAPNGKSVFPLSWGMDNEVLNSVVFHTHWPTTDQIRNANLERLMASALDFPAGLGNELAIQSIQQEIHEYPILKQVLSDLSQRPWKDGTQKNNLYNGWLQALAVQWKSKPLRPSNLQDWGSWNAKRLQTGLASWATLRHSTVLVNETSGAECGEGGFEDIVLRPPKGYVEPDPMTFHAIADLFQSAAKNLGDLPEFSGKLKEQNEESEMPLRQGLLRKLNESAQIARKFANMAQSELNGKPLSDSNYSDILWAGRFAEHHFLVYKSVSNQGLGLPSPEPIPKIADIAHGPSGAPYLFAAVGQPMEWNQIVPFYGRREMVKGPIYSFYEFISDTLYNDKEWQNRLSNHSRPAWVQPFVIPHNLICPAQSVY